MPTAEEFDEFYVSTRRDLILQTFALTGDLAASRAAVRDSYVAARHHWDKVGKETDPLSWVRPKAWSRAQRRHSISPWHRERHIDADQTATLEALHKLRDAQRRTLVLHVLTELSMEQIGREIGLPLARVVDHLESATQVVTEDLNCTPEELSTRLVGLGQAVDTVKLPRPTIVRRNGLRRRRNFAIAGSVAIGVVMVSTGSFVAVGSPEDTVSRSQSAKLIKTTRSQLLTEAQIASLAAGQAWQKPVTSQNDDENSSGLNTSCQQERYADKAADGALVRTFTTASGPRRTLVEAVEISKTTAEAEAAYLTTRNWYAGCRADRIRLKSSYDIDQVGDQAQVLILAGPKKSDPSFAVGLARTGKLTLSMVLEVKVSTQVKVGTVTATLATAVRNLCSSAAAGECVGQVLSEPTRPPPTGDVTGMLAAVDLPPISDIKARWNDTPAAPPVPNTAANTPCDKTDFIKGGAINPLSRSFLMSNDNAPKVFGVTQTIGKFSSAKAAAKFADTLTSRMRSCEKRVLSSTISTAVVKPGSGATPPYGYWRLVNQTQNRNEVTYWMGYTRVGSYVAQVTMTPVRDYDVSAKTFADLVLRSRDRLYEFR